MPKNPMSPAASPGTLARPGSGVRRVNNIPVYLGLFVVSAFVVIIALVAADRATEQRKPASAPKQRSVDSGVLARQIAGTQPEGIVPAKDMPEAHVSPRPSAPAAPVPLAPSAPGPGNDEVERIREAKFQQLAEASRAKTAVPLVALRIVESSAPVSEARSRSVEPPSSPPLHGGRPARLMGGSPRSGPATTNPPTDRWRLDSRPEAPRSRYEVRAGFVIPAVLMTGINSDLPGQIMAQVSESVYDTPTGNYLLIPQGSRLVGTYASDVAFGQGRVLIAWQRIVFPDGKAMDIGNMPGADGAGYAGFADRANNHYLRLFGSAILLSAVTAGIAYSQSQGQNQQGGYSAPTVGSAISEAVGQQLGQATAQLLAKNMNISPTLEIRPGYRFNVMLTKDLTFDKPYRSFDY